jgi:hypothetical protein
MVCKALELHLRGVHGAELWRRTRIAAQLEFDSFETLSLYDDATFDRVVGAAAAQVNVPRNVLLEDLGTWLCTDPSMEAVRRLMRFSGVTYLDFLHSLDELHERARMAVPRLDLPAISLTECEQGDLSISTTWRIGGAAAALTGILRAMADDHGVLALIEAGTTERRGPLFVERISCRVVDAGFAAPRSFTLARQGAPDARAGGEAGS